MKFPQINRHRAVLFLIVFVSLTLRIFLSLNGGQFFFPDETRYRFSRQAEKKLETGDISEALIFLTSSPSHLGYKIAGIIPAWIERRMGANPYVPAIFFSLFSVFNIALVWLLALKLDASQNEALWAAFLTAASNTLFYYSAHIFPYDIAMTFGLISLWFALKKQYYFAKSLAVGLFAFFCFITYNGYWVLAALVQVVHVVYSPQLKTAAQKGITALLGFSSTFLFIQWISMTEENNLWRSLVYFSDTINQGDYSEGAVLPFKYLWSAEAMYFALLLALIFYSVVLLQREKPARIVLWLGSVVFIYASLVIPSVVLHKFVVYGRLVRQMIPFMALTGAFALDQIGNGQEWKASFTWVTVIAITLQAGLNFSQAFRIVYPDTLIKEMQIRDPNFKKSISPTDIQPTDIIEADDYIFYNFNYIYPAPRSFPIIGEVVISAPHPQLFEPFLYEGISPEQRAIFMKSNLKMVVTRKP